uniref:Uncharacterized protein n=1 Tax=uncultured bacterium RM44 TaxID=672208 RepID=D3W8M5_9BACT|nr:hypothetical protein [uncultured bacterium RM44]
MIANTAIVENEYPFDVRAVQIYIERMSGRKTASGRSSALLTCISTFAVTFQEIDGIFTFGIDRSDPREPALIIVPSEHGREMRITADCTDPMRATVFVDLYNKGNEDALFVVDMQSPEYGLRELPAVCPEKPGQACRCKSGRGRGQASS